MIDTKIGVKNDNDGGGQYLSCSSK